MSSLAVVPVAARSIIYLETDVHKDSITIAVLPAMAKAPTRLERLPNDLPKLKKWMDRVPVRMKYTPVTRRVGPGTCDIARCASGATPAR